MNILLSSGENFKIQRATDDLSVYNYCSNGFTLKSALEKVKIFLYKLILCLGNNNFYGKSRENWLAQVPERETVSRPHHAEVGHVMGFNYFVRFVASWILIMRDYKLSLECLNQSILFNSDSRTRKGCRSALYRKNKSRLLKITHPFLWNSQIK